MSLILEVLKREEGVRLEPYKDHLGYWTVGVGHLIDRRKGGSLPAWIRASFPLEEKEVDELLAWDVRKHGDSLDEWLGTWWRDLDEVRGAVLLSMAFQMGGGGVAGFKNTLLAVQEGRWADAAAGMRGSLWYRQTTQRAERHARAMESGDRASLGL